MAAARVLLDTSVIVGHLRGTSDWLMRLEEMSRSGKVRLFLPLIVVVELFAGRSTRKKQVIQQVNKLVEGLEKVDLDWRAAMRAGRLIRDLPQVPDPYDVVIAAMAIEAKAEVATLNKKHFAQIKGVKLWHG